MVIVTRSRCRIDTLCQMLCRFLAQITQQQHHRLRASQTAGIAKCTPAQLLQNDKTAPRQRPGVIRPSTPAGKNLLALITCLHQ
ncbi:hypothetical protein DP20_3198 [Shigella flexneri]|nr:hypothetical protein DP20_3198 [Shigella flexneri]